MLPVYRLYSVVWCDGRSIGRDLEGTDNDLIEVLSRHLPGETEEML
jgi:hypothetical protein